MITEMCTLPTKSSCTVTTCLVKVFSDFSSRYVLELGSQDNVKCFNCMYICSSPKLISVFYSFLSDTFVIVCTILFLIIL